MANKRPTVSSLQKELAEVNAKLAAKSKLDEEQSAELARLEAEKMGRFKFPDFRYYLANSIWNVVLVAMVLYGAYSILNSKAVLSFFEKSGVIQKDEKTDEQLSMQELSSKYGGGIVDPQGLGGRLNALAQSIDQSNNPVNALRPVVQFEDSQWREATGAAFQRGLNMGTRPSGMVRDMAAGLPARGSR